MVETVTLKGQKLTLRGTLVKEGQMAPDCELIGPDLQPIKLSSYKGKVLILMSVPSLDTPVCSKETRRFNQEMEQFKEQVRVICVSMDLPFAQSRWCAAEGIKNVVTLSDYKAHEFGERYGVLIEEIGLLARALFLVDPNMKIVASQLVKEVSQEPNYPQIFEQVNQLIASIRG